MLVLQIVGEGKLGKGYGLVHDQQSIAHKTCGAQGPINDGAQGTSATS